MRYRRISATLNWNGGKPRIGIWLITAANSEYSTRETSIDTSITGSGQLFPGCQICIITLHCGRRIICSHIKLQSDLATCRDMSAVTIKLNLTDTLQHIIGTVSQIENLPAYYTKRTTAVALLRHLRGKFVQGPEIGKIVSLVEIAGH